jgi:hypothetical protein
MTRWKSGIAVALIPMSILLACLPPQSNDTSIEAKRTVNIKKADEDLEKKVRCSITQITPQSVRVIMDLRKLKPYVSVTKLTLKLQALAKNGKLLNEKEINFTEEAQKPDYLNQYSTLFGGKVYERIFKLDKPLAEKPYKIKGADVHGLFGVNVPAGGQVKPKRQ